MEEEKSPPQTEEINELEASESDLTGYIYNLANSFNCLCEIDGKILPKKQERQLLKMKEQIFNSLVYYCESLPELEPEKKESL